MFLKEVSDFSYDNSEDLGNAFEYLLSIMGSQGDAGQFRTPRHIIDMMVEIVDPKKNETILDPACGTAGFLISAYRHILAQNKDEDGKPLSGKGQALRSSIRGLYCRASESNRPGSNHCPGGYCVPVCQCL